MSDKLITGITTVLLGIIGVAFIGALVTQGTNTTGVISAAANGFAADLACAAGTGTCGGYTGPQ